MYHDGVRILECFQILIFFVIDSCGEDIEIVENVIVFFTSYTLTWRFPLGAAVEGGKRKSA